MLRVLSAPRGLDLRVSTIVVHDPIDDLADEPDGLLLMLGVAPHDGAASALVADAARHGYCAVVIKRRGRDVAEFVAESARVGLCVLALADEVSWLHLDGLLHSSRETGDLGDEAATGAGDELFALADSIAAEIGGSVAIEDMARRVLAYSSTSGQRIDAIREQGILDRRVPNMVRNDEQYQRVLATTGVVRFAEVSDECARSAIAITAGLRPLGTIWAIEGDHGLDDRGEEAMVRGSRLAALKILRSLNTNGLEMHLREAGLLRALDGSLSAREMTFRLALPGDCELTLVGFAVVHDDDGRETGPLITHVAGVLSRYVAAYRPDASMATTTRTVYLLLPGGGEQDTMRFVAGALRATHEVFGNQVRAGIAASSYDPADLSAMRSQIDEIVRATTTRAGLPNIARLADVHTEVLLSLVADELVHQPALRHPGVDAMVAHDRERGTHYGETTLAWLECLGDFRTAARGLGIHPNTLRYRLGRVPTMFDIGLDRPDDRLAVWMQLRLTCDH